MIEYGVGGTVTITILFWLVANPALGKWRYPLSLLFAAFGSFGGMGMYLAQLQQYGHVFGVNGFYFGLF